MPTLAPSAESDGSAGTQSSESHGILQNVTEIFRMSRKCHRKVTEKPRKHHGKVTAICCFASSNLRDGCTSRGTPHTTRSVSNHHTQPTISTQYVHLGTPPNQPQSHCLPNTLRESPKMSPPSFLDPTRNSSQRSGLCPRASPAAAPSAERAPLPRPTGCVPQGARRSRRRGSCPMASVNRCNGAINGPANGLMTQFFKHHAQFLPWGDDTSSDG